MNEQTQTMIVDEEDNGDTTNLSNDQRFNDFIKRARKYGADAAAGADSLPKLALDLTRMSKDGVIDLDANKKAIHEIYDVYWNSRVKKGVHTQGKEGRIAQVSKLKAFHTLGGNTSFDGEEVLNRAVVLYKEMLDAEIKLKSVYAAYVDVARMANDYKSDTNSEPSDDDIKAAMLPKDKDAPTVADVIQKNRDILEALITGERKDGLTCQDQEIIDAVGKLDEWLEPRH